MAVCEVCVEGLSGAIAAASGGAQRIELCAGLIEGGTTPSAGTVALALDRAPIDIVAMIRPRGGDFLYSDDEFETMLRDVDSIRAAGVFGIATGMLLRDGTVDVERTARIVEAAQPMSVTFHRAFDMTRDPRESLESLVDLGVDRVLTSGQKRNVSEGLNDIRDLVERAAGRIVVMPGCGVEESNVHDVLETTGASEVHFTAFRCHESQMDYRNPAPMMGGAKVPGEYELQVTDPDRVRNVVWAANHEI